MLERRLAAWADRAGRIGYLQARFLRSRDAASAVEFALVSMLFTVTLLMVMSVAFIAFLQQQLDFATTKAARQVMNGSAQQAGYSGTDFRTQVVCPALPAVFNCNDVVVNLQTVTQGGSPGGYYAFVTSDLKGLVIPQLSNAVSQYNPGTQGSYEYLQVVYPITFLPSIVVGLLSGSTYNGAPAFLAVSTSAFRNEQY